MATNTEAVFELRKQFKICRETFSRLLVSCYIGDEVKSLLQYVTNLFRTVMR